LPPDNSILDGTVFSGPIPFCASAFSLVQRPPPDWPAGRRGSPVLSPAFARGWLESAFVTGLLGFASEYLARGLYCRDAAGPMRTCGSSSPREFAAKRGEFSSFPGVFPVLSGKRRAIALANVRSRSAFVSASFACWIVLDMRLLGSDLKTGPISIRSSSSPFSLYCWWPFYWPVLARGLAAQAPDKPRLYLFIASSIFLPAVLIPFASRLSSN
jgi:hypothetical protein